ncbi:uncharacterized protein F5147DRAFT_653256 [Suillus discolor]|uniref:Uncharacterized protein n=1 Tax=Suillus discolor TaxID=1912936 RepID=A0A9P7JTE5_9AGAM|nr:uncharacterized protein F5147DRAFT_653256 [Suillus discolor]KAG2107747.1 hypothetical protein F5147DRAFT_653256 [Suillus discolor]
MNSQTDLQHATAHTISPIKKLHAPVTNIHLATANKILLLASLHQAEAANVALKKCIITLQASNVLNEMYCVKIRSQLAHQESKKQFEEAQTRAAAEKRIRTKERKRHAEALTDWKKLEDARKAENKAQQEHYYKALQILT